MLTRNSSRLVRNVLALTITSALLGCGGASDSVPDPSVVPPRPELQLVFEDEFDGNSLDMSKWNIEVGDGCPDLCGWGNNEQQLYSPDNITVAGGTLTIQAREEANGDLTSARINTRGKFDFRYGRVEVRARLPVGQGLWPAIWLLHSDPNVYGPWPASGEIDIMEAFNPGNGNNRISSSTHYGIPTQPFTYTTSDYDLGVPPDMAFHTYAVEWERDNIRFFVDDQHFQTQRSDDFGDDSDDFDGWYAYFPADDTQGFYDPFGAFKKGPKNAPFDQLFHLILNLAVGGDAVADPDRSALPQNFEIDYVRIYECANADPDTGLGCGTAGPQAELLRDSEGGPLEGLDLGQPYTDLLDLYVDGPEIVELDVGTEVATNMLMPEIIMAPGATVSSDPFAADPDVANNIVWAVSVTGGGGVALASEDLTDDPILDTGFDFSDNRRGGIGENAIGEIAFRMRVDSLDLPPGTDLTFQLDSGDGDIGEAVLPASEIRLGEWKTYSMKGEVFANNPVPGGNGVDFESVIKPFVLLVPDGGNAEIIVDDIRATIACKVISACGVDPKIKGLPDLIVYDDAVNLAVWDNGTVASDSGTNFTDYTDPSNPANKVNWREIMDTDPNRGQVLEVTYNDSPELGVFFIQSSNTLNLSAYSGGAVVFDIKVLDYGTATPGITVKISCVASAGCSSGDRQIGAVGDGVWETVEVPLSTFIAGGLDIFRVDTGLEVFPTDSNNVGTQVLLLDNIRWVETTEAPPLQQIDLPVTFDDPNVDYSLFEFQGQGTALVTDPEDLSGTNTVAQTTKGSGAATFAGTVIGTLEGFANPIAFTPTETALSLRVYPPGPGFTTRLQIETVDGSAAVQFVDVDTTATNAWETQVFDFGPGAVGLGYDRAVVFFNFGQIGAGNTFLWDDVQVGMGGPPLSQIDLPVTFDDPTVNYTLVDFLGAFSSITTDPDPNDPTNQVAQVLKTADPQSASAGTTIGGINGFANPIPFTAMDTRMNVRVYPPGPGIPVLLKVETADPNVFVQTQVNTTATNAWETLEFDFGSVGLDLGETYVRAVIFFDFGNLGNDDLYYWDDLAFGSAAP